MVINISKTYSILLLFLAVSILFTTAISELKTNKTYTSVLPINSPSITTYFDFDKEFQTGAMLPLKIMIISKSHHVQSQEYWNFNDLVISRLIADLKPLSLNEISNINFINSTYVSLPEALQLLSNNEQRRNVGESEVIDDDLKVLYNYIYNISVSRDEMSSLIYLHPTWNVFITQYYRIHAKYK
eukprot:UN02724